jgi:hypothetical protein
VKQDDPHDTWIYQRSMALPTSVWLRLLQLEQARLSEHATHTRTHAHTITYTDTRLRFRTTTRPDDSWPPLALPSGYTWRAGQNSIIQPLASYTSIALAGTSGPISTSP